MGFMICIEFIAKCILKWKPTSISIACNKSFSQEKPFSTVSPFSNDAICKRSPGSPNVNQLLATPRTSSLEWRKNKHLFVSSSAVVTYTARPAVLVAGLHAKPAPIWCLEALNLCGLIASSWILFFFRHFYPFHLRLASGQWPPLISFDFLNYFFFPTYMTNSY